MRIFILVITFLQSCFAAGQDNFSISGKVDSLKNGYKIYLVYQVEDQQIADSTTIVNGNFTFAGKLKYPVFSALYLHKNPYVNRPAKGEAMDYFRFYLEPAQIKMQAPDSLKKIIITNSPGNELNAKLRGMLKANDEKFATLGKEFRALPKEKQENKAVLDSVINREKQILAESYQIHLDFANRYPDAYLSLISLSHIAAQPGMTTGAEKAYQKLPQKLKDTPLGKGIPLQLASQRNTQIGSIAPDFEQGTPEGKTLKLSGFRNKYLLLDFWASWCGPCREENPNLVAAYKKYKDKGFEILGVSLDGAGQRKAWVDAIATDQLSWAQVSDLKGWDNAAAQVYGIRSIPGSFLIDPSGKIIAKNLRGKDLQEKLESLFKGK